MKKEKVIPDFPDELVRAKKSKKLVVFIGAGLSCSAGLLGWDALKNQMIDALEVGDVTDLASFKDGLQKEPNFYKCFDSILERDPKAYNRVMKEALKPTDAMTRRFNTLYSYISELEPISVVTLNVDPLLADNCKYSKVRKPTMCWPWEIEEGRFFFFHGLVSHDGSHEGMLVFGEQELQKRYRQSDASRFLYGLFSGYFTVLFIGFSFSDEQLLSHGFIPPEVAEEIRLGRRQPFHYALLPENDNRAKNSAEKIGAKVLMYSLNAEPSKRFENFELTLKSWSAIGKSAEFTADAGAIPETRIDL